MKENFFEICLYTLVDKLNESENYFIPTILQVLRNMNLYSLLSMVIGRMRNRETVSL